jgi:hypothetical protein
MFKAAAAQDMATEISLSANHPPPASCPADGLFHYAGFTTPGCQLYSCMDFWPQPSLALPCPGSSSDASSEVPIPLNLTCASLEGLNERKQRGTSFGTNFGGGGLVLGSLWEEPRLGRK